MKLLWILLLLSFNMYGQVWFKVGHQPFKPRYQAGWFSNNHRGYVVCGDFGGGKGSDTVWEFKPTSNKWKAVTVFPGGPRNSPVAVVIEGKAYVGLGYDINNGIMRQDWYQYDFTLNKWSLMDSFPGNARNDCGRFVISHYGYIVGGTNGGPPYLSDAYRYDANTNKWYAIASLPKGGLSGPLTLSINGAGYLFGGWNNPKALTQILKYDTTLNKWTIINHFHDTTFSNQRGFTVCNKLYLVVGQKDDTTGTYSDASRDVYIYNSTSNLLTKEPYFPGPVRDHAVAFDIDGLGYLMDGWIHGSTIYNDVWRFTPNSITKTIDTTFCSAHSLGLTAKAGYKYNWSTGDTTNIIIAKDSGSYIISYDSTGGCTGYIDTFIVKSNSFLLNTLHDTTLCAGSTLILDAGNKGARYSWNNKDTTETIKPTTSGQYKVQLSVNGCNITDSCQVTFDLYKIYLASMDTTVCSLGHIGVKRLKGFAYKWSTGDTTISIAVDTTNTYVLKMDSMPGCKLFIDSFHVIVNPYPIINIKDTTSCKNDSIILDAGNTGATYKWNTGDTSRTIKPISNGRYSVRITLHGCLAIDSFKVTILNNPVLKKLFDTTICAGNRVIFNPGKVVGATYNWNTGLTSQTLQTDSAGTYSVIVRTGNDCATTEIVHVIVVNNPVVSLGKDTVLCHKDPIILDAGSPGASYIWNTGATTKTIQVDSSGTYVVSVTLHNCSASGQIKVYFLTQPVLHLLSPTICRFNPVYIKVDSLPFTTYFWNTGSTSPRVMVKDTGIYWVRVSNACGSYSDTTKLTESPNCPCLLYMPDAFSPNNDGLNDYYKPLIDCPIYNINFRIFNRWGQLIFQSNKIDGKWDGTFHDQPQPVDVYVWYLTYTTQNGKNALLKGNVTLVK